jgi:hypothetical protein
VQDLDHRCDQIYQWAKSRDDESPDGQLVAQIQERIVELEETVKSIGNKPPPSNFEEVLQNDLNTLYDVLPPSSKINVRSSNAMSQTTTTCLRIKSS